MAVFRPNAMIERATKLFNARRLCSNNKQRASVRGALRHRKGRGTMLKNTVNKRR
jgi:hypothetical protein